MMKMMMMKLIDDVLGEPRHSGLLPSSEKMGHPLPKPGLVVHDQIEVNMMPIEMGITLITLPISIKFG